MGTTACRWRGRSAFALAVWLGAAVPAAAGSFSIAPVRIEMDTGRSTGVVTLHNLADAPVTVQVETTAWSQPGGTDRYDPTHDLIVTPPVFVLPAKGDQIVRVARRAPPDAVTETAYRLFFTEVPDSTVAAGTALRVSLRIGIPVFVAPAARGSAPALEFAGQVLEPGTIEISAINHGRAHVQITDFEVASASGRVLGEENGSSYLLPGASARWSVKTPGDWSPSGVVKIHGHGDHGGIAAEIAMPAR